MKDRWCPLITTSTAFGCRRRWCPGYAAQGPAECSTAAVAFCVDAAGTFPIARAETAWNRMVSRMQKLWARVGGSANLMELFPPRRHRT
jgi:hypothetical protein